MFQHVLEAPPVSSAMDVQLPPLPDFPWLDPNATLQLDVPGWQRSWIFLDWIPKKHNTGIGISRINPLMAPAYGTWFQQPHKRRVGWESGSSGPQLKTAGTRGLAFRVRGSRFRVPSWGQELLSCPCINSGWQGLPEPKFSKPPKTPN